MDQTMRLLTDSMRFKKVEDLQNFLNKFEERETSLGLIYYVEKTAQ